MNAISLPEPLHAAAEEMAARAGFDGVEQYIAELVRRDVEQNPPEPSPPPCQIGEGSASREFTAAEWVGDDRKLEALLLEGLNSGPATEMTAEDWASIRREVRERRERRNKS